MGTTSEGAAAATRASLEEKLLEEEEEEKLYSTTRSSRRSLNWNDACGQKAVVAFARASSKKLVALRPTSGQPCSGKTPPPKWVSRGRATFEAFARHDPNPHSFLGLSTRCHGHKTGSSSRPFSRSLVLGRRCRRRGKHKPAASCRQGPAVQRSTPALQENSGRGKNKLVNQNCGAKENYKRTIKK